MAIRSEVEERLRKIEAVTDAALAGLGGEQLLRELLERACELLGVDTAAVLLHDAAAGQLVATVALGIEDEVRYGVRVPVGAGFAGRVAAERKPVIVEEVDESDVVPPLLWEKGLRVLVVLPMLVGGELIGVLHVGSPQERRFSDDDVSFLQMVADRIALTTRAQLSSAEHAAAVALQRSLLPARLPAVAGLQFAARYVPGASTGVGGDWYDVFRLPGDRLGMVMGDVAGHGLPAAVVMGRLRSALRAYALESDDPVEVLEKLHRKAIHFEVGVMTTVAYAIVDPPGQRLRLSLAGHLPPVLVVPGRQAAFIDVPVDPPIGVLPAERRRRSSVVQLPQDSLICLYTDGLIERRGRSIDVGLQQLRQTITTGLPETVCAQLMATCVGTQPVEDDIALLLMRRLADD